jgi:hypothetical protein
VYAFTVLYNPAIMTTKTAILILYYRMAATYPFLRYASLFTIAVINIAGVVLTFLYRHRRALPILHAHQRPH